MRFLNTVFQFTVNVKQYFNSEAIISCDMESNTQQHVVYEIIKLSFCCSVNQKKLIYISACAWKKINKFKGGAIKSQANHKTQLKYIHIVDLINITRRQWIPFNSIIQSSIYLKCFWNTFWRGKINKLFSQVF